MTPLQSVKFRVDEIEIDIAVLLGCLATPAHCDTVCKMGSGRRTGGCLVCTHGEPYVGSVGLFSTAKRFDQINAVMKVVWEEVFAPC